MAYPSAPEDEFFERVINPYLVEVLQPLQEICQLFDLLSVTLEELVIDL